MEKKAVIQPQDKYVLRLPDGLRRRIKNEAILNRRSMNQEIVSILENWYGSMVWRLHKDGADMETAIDGANRRIDSMQKMRELLDLQGELIKEQQAMLAQLVDRTEE